nr:MAG TPA: hypothetical protein [Caudoviricetes sp.]
MILFIAIRFYKLSLYILPVWYSIFFLGLGLRYFISDWSLI